MNRPLLGFVVFAAVIGTHPGCENDKPRKRDAGESGDGTGGSLTGGSGGTGGSLTGGSGGTGGSAGTGGARLDAAADARPDTGPADVLAADVTSPGDLARDTAVVPADAAADLAAAPADAAVDAPLDAAADVAPDLAPDVAPDLAPDVARDVAPDLAPDVAPDAMTMQFMALPGCSTANGYTTAQGLSSTVNFGGGVGSAYSPRCLKVARTAQVTFSGNFGGHPLSPTTGMGSPSNPITSTGSGSSATFTFNASGFFPYHCDFHDQSAGMHGVIWVTE